MISFNLFYNNWLEIGIRKEINLEERRIIIWTNNFLLTSNRKLGKHFKGWLNTLLLWLLLLLSIWISYKNNISNKMKINYFNKCIFHYIRNNLNRNWNQYITGNSFDVNRLLIVSIISMRSFIVASNCSLNKKILWTSFHKTLEISLYFQSVNLLLLNSILWFCNILPTPLCA